MRRRSGFAAFLPQVTLVLSDVVLLLAAYWLAYHARFELSFLPFQEMHPWRRYLDVVGLQMLLLVPVFAAHGLYRLRRTISYSEELYGVFTAVSIDALLVLVAAVLVQREFIYSRGVIVFGWLLSVLLVTLGRYVYYSLRATLRAAGLDMEKVLIVGTDETAKMVYERIQQSPQLGYLPIGFLRSRGGNGVEIFEGLPVLGDLEDVDQVVKRHGVEHVIVAVPGLAHEDLVMLVGKCRAQDVNIRVFPDIFQLSAGQVNIDELNGLPLVTVKDIALRGYRLALKRLMDLIFSGFLLLLLSGPMLLIAVLVKLSGPRAPVFYAQERVGLDGRPFPMIKFRTMRPDAEQTTGPVWAKKDDPRRTRLGTLLRRFSIDELPQLINVLVGEMSMVGPRPERPHFVEQFSQVIPRYAERHREKAGLTGWAQVNGLRGDTSIEERTAYDLWYVENWNLWLDVKIVMRTLFVIFGDKNAY
ncbi:MAG: undecaprenyl-phosphate glucose phosphotransferase [Chloroflexi bacterium]|nr:undecaprenyl-phosphate glucose phosphotransferase [Chloroflexota bacterium]MCL5108170.1 undecaprenyl-phosphate glucose phosphotransferase [Chloroflexota bacterium]